MRFLKPTLALIGFALVISGCNSQKIKRVELKNDLDSLSYAIGVNMGTNIKNSDIIGVNYFALINGIDDVQISKKDMMSPEQAMEIINKFLGKLSEVKGAKNLEDGKKFMEDNAKKEGVISDPAGFQYKILKEGTGATPAETDVVKVNYIGTFIDGKEFDASEKHGGPVEFPLNQVIRGWGLGLQKVKVGGKIMLYVPSELAYGPRGPLGPNQTLIFEIELLEIVKKDVKK